MVIATTRKKEDKRIINIAKKNKVDFFCGDSENVLKRYYVCAKKFHADIIIRITSDCPLVDFELVDRMLDFYQNNKYDYISNAIKPSFPDGLDVAIF